MTFPRDYWEKLGSLKAHVGTVGRIADTPQGRLSPDFPGESSGCRYVDAKSERAEENAISADTEPPEQLSPGIMRESLEKRCRQLLPTLPTPRPYEMRFPASSPGKVEFWVTDDVGNCRQLEIDECATCRHWRTNRPRIDPVTKKVIKNQHWCDECRVDHDYGHCTQLVYVQKHVYGTAFEKGDVLTMDELRIHGLQNVDYLNTGPHFYCHMYELKEGADADAA